MGDRIDVDSTQNIISFCTGYGGIELGIRRAGVDVRTVVNVEIEAFCCANLGAKIEEALMDDAPIYTDLKTFPAEIFRGKVHGITCGYPCQPFSSAGKRKGEKDPRHLWPYIRRHIRAIGPSWVLAENVRGHTTMGLWRVLSDLEEDGYRTEWGLYSAEETGAPHQRIRCFILAKLPDTSGEGLQRDELGGSCDEQVKGLQGSYEPTSELHKVRDESREVADSNYNGHCAESRRDGEEEAVPREHRPEVCGGMPERTSGQPSELAYTASREPRQSQARNGGQDTSGGSEDTRWPARPGEEQYEWEEPRVVADSKVKRCGGRKNKDGENGEGLSEQEGEERSILRSETEGCCGNEQTTCNEAQSCVGLSTHGTSTRVDELRLLGNGVVPQTAELAWKSLWRKMNEQL